MKSWVTRGLGALAMVSTLAVAHPVAAQPAVAESTAHITLYPTGAPATAWVTVEWQKPSDGTWATVTGWQGDLDYTQAGVAYKQWSVERRDYGTGPFRWVVFATNGGSVWGTSPSFTLPTDASANLVTTLTGAPIPATTVAAATSTPTAPVTPAASMKTLTAWSQTLGFETRGAAIARITMMIAPVSPTTFVGVQYLDANGAWQNVQGWQTVATINDKGIAVVQWGLSKASFGQGPMRWIVYGAQGGTVIGVSPVFRLPTDQGVDYVLHLAP